MAKDKATLRADGVVTVSDLHVIAEALGEMLASLTDETAQNPEAIEWVVDGLRAGSATIISRGRAGTYLASNAVGDVIDRYERLARQAHHGRLDEFPPTVQKAVRRLAEMVDGRITRISLGASDREWPIDPSLSGGGDQPDVVVGVDVNRYARSSVKGQVVTLDDKHGLYFTLREVQSGRLIRCYPTEAVVTRTALSDYWAKTAWVIVEGTYSRYTEPATLTAITGITPLGDASPGGWRDAIGCAPRRKNHDVSAADAVRRIRDG